METKDCEEIFLDPYDPKDFDDLKFSPIDSTFLSMSDVVPTLLSNSGTLSPPKTRHRPHFPISRVPEALQVQALPDNSLEVAQ